MEKNNYIVATIKTWNIERYYRFISEKKYNNFHLITDPKTLTIDNIKKFDPKYIFFPHWSWMIPKNIYSKYTCIAFHMTDLPFGRGGTPLQNLISRQIYATRISAFKVKEGIDTGLIYLKRYLDLHGSAKDIFIRYSKIVFEDMIDYIINNDIVPTEQLGNIVYFERRIPEQSSIENLHDVEKVYDHIRMLDAETYPRAFLETKNLRLEFSDASMHGNHVEAKVNIRIK